MSIFFAGFSLSLSLIVAIGSQNAFVLKQGIQGQQVFVICLVCALSDAILISFGVAGFGAIINTYPQIESVARYGGALFLAIYSMLSFKSAFTLRHALTATVKTYTSKSKAVLMCLVFTWLNPHVYLDTVVLLGSISTQYQPQHFEFALGAIFASFMFFFLLGYGAKYLAPIFEKPKAWQILEVIIGIVMAGLALSLII